MDESAIVLLMVTYFLVKHFVCDFPIHIQTPWMFKNKGTYGHQAGFAHAFIQAGASAPILLLTWNYAPRPDYLVLLLVGEWFIHYHVDWFKMWLNKKRNYHTQTPQFWTLLGLDQLVHGLTYVGMIAIWLL